MFKLWILLCCYGNLTTVRGVKARLERELPNMRNRKVVPATNMANLHSKVHKAMNTTISSLTHQHYRKPMACLDFLHCVLVTAEHF